jgi:hypothetical protein
MFESHEVREDLRSIAQSLREIVSILRHLFSLNPTALAVRQGDSPVITGVTAGSSATFVESYVPANAALPAGASISIVWTVDDTLVTLTPSADGTQVVAAIDPSDTATSFNLTATGTSSALPGPITSGPVNVPILPAAPPLPTALAIDQVAAASAPAAAPAAQVKKSAIE